MNPDKVSQATRNRVEQAALEVGYLPQSLSTQYEAQRMAADDLVIIPDICDPFFSEVTRGIEVTAAEHGYLALIGDCAHQNQKEKLYRPYHHQADRRHGAAQLPRPSSDASAKSSAICRQWSCRMSLRRKAELPTVHIDNSTAAFTAVNDKSCDIARMVVIAGPEDMPQPLSPAVICAGAAPQRYHCRSGNYIARGNFT